MNKTKGEKNAEGKGPRKNNLKVIHTAESQSENLAPSCVNTDNFFWKISPS